MGCGGLEDYAKWLNQGVSDQLKVSSERTKVLKHQSAQCNVSQPMQAGLWGFVILLSAPKTIFIYSLYPKLQ